MAQLRNRVALVTGGAQGIGGATARLLAAEGAHVVIGDIDEMTARENVAHIRDAGGSADAIRADMSRAEDIDALFSRAESHSGSLHILVNNAYGPTGPGATGSALDVTDDGWDRGMSLLVKSYVQATRKAIPLMRRAGGGAIVNISSVHGLLMAPGALVYEAGKMAVIGVTRQTAIDFGPDGVRVNAICPGHIVTERGAARWAERPGGLAFFDQQYPVRRTGVPDDIARAVLFLVSDQSSFVTGVALPVDGGLTIQLQENLGVRLAKWAREHPETPMPY
ncbi:MAG: glucose 1-dehydrogenase [Chloroflexi bacterium]|nr:glucose 1-dehydrogenase [Chloroflexota bacterium]